MHGKLSFTEWPKLIEFWLLIVVGLTLCFLHWVGLVDDKEIGTLWLAVLIFTITATCLDFDAWSSAILLFLAAFLITVTFLVANYFTIPVIGPVLRWIGAADLGIKPGAVFTASTILGVIWVLVYLWGRRYWTWYVRIGKMERRKFGGGTEEILIGPQRRVTYEIPDWLDWMLTMGGGYLIVQTELGTRHLGIVFGVRAMDDQIDEYERMPTAEGHEPVQPPPDEVI